MCRASEGSSVNSETQKKRTFRRRKEKEAETFPHQSLIFHEGNIRPDSHEAVWNLKPTSANPRDTRTREALKVSNIPSIYRLKKTNTIQSRNSRPSCILGGCQICWKLQGDSQGREQIRSYLKIFARFLMSKETLEILALYLRCYAYSSI